MIKMLLLILCFSFSSCSSFKEWEYLPDTISEERSIYVISHQWHTGIIISANDITEDLSFVKDHIKKKDYYEFGWGDADFYQADNPTIPMGIKALLYPTRSVVHLSSFNGRPELNFPFSKIIKINLSKEGLCFLQESLVQSFERGENGEPVKLKKGLYGESYFFKGEDYYSIRKNCNSWSADILQSGGIPMDSFFNFTASSILEQARNAMKRYTKPIK